MLICYSEIKWRYNNKKMKKKITFRVSHKCDNTHAMQKLNELTGKIIEMIITIIITIRYYYYYYYYYYGRSECYYQSRLVGFDCFVSYSCVDKHLVMTDTIFE